jgi:hypothetical protein
MVLVSWLRKRLWLAEVSNSRVSRKREECLHRSRDGRFPDDSAALAPTALPVDAVPIAETVETGGAFGAGCSVTFGGEVLGASGKYD